MWIVLLIVAVLIVYAVSSDIDGSIKLLKDSVKKTGELLWQTEESDTQKKIKEIIKKISVRLLNIFFLLVVLVAMWWGLESLYDEYRYSIPLFVESLGGAWRNFYLIFVVSLSAVVVLFVGINVLLWLFKLVKITDVYKVYLFIELIGLLWKYPSAQGEDQKLLVIQLFNKVFEKEIIKQPKVDKDEVKGIPFDPAKIKIYNNKTE